MTDQVTNPMDAINQPFVPRPFYTWGTVTVDAYFASPEKGLPPYDPEQHSRKVTVVNLNIYPISEMRSDKAFNFKLLDTTQKWGLVQSSIFALGTKPGELNNKFVKITFENTGSTYEKDGETKDEKYPKFLAIFQNQQECVADYYNTTNAGGDDTATPGPQQQAPANSNGSNGNGNGNGNGNDKEKEVAIKFAKVVVKSEASGKTDLDVIRQGISTKFATMPHINKHLTVDSPEVVEMIVEAMAS